MNSAKLLIACIGLIYLAGCGIQQTKPEPTPEPVIKADSVIAQDFVNIMVQIDDLSPWSTVLNFGLDEASSAGSESTALKAQKNFGKALRAAASKSGYVVKTVGDEQGPNLVSYNITEAIDELAGSTYTYNLSIGDVDFRRAYKPLEGDRVEPHEAMLVRGTDVANLESDDSHFANQINSASGALVATADATLSSDGPSLGGGSAGFDSPVAQQDQARQQPFDSSTEFASNEVLSVPATNQPSIGVSAPLLQSSADSSETNATELLITKPDVVAQPVNVANRDGFETVRKINIAVSGTSNYENLLADKQNVAEEILIFGDDSYVLGARNKKILGEMMGTFDPETDVVSVVGCSTGVTKIANGNAALAIGRANRVKEALLYSGIPHDKIYDEGCWSPTPNSTPFPNRGVVITVKRNVNNG